MRGNDDRQQSFGLNENRTPDPAAVYAAVEALSRTPKRRRRGVQVAGGVAVGAGLLVGLVGVPAAFASEGSKPAHVTQVAATASAKAPAKGKAAPSPSASVSEEQARNAYFAAGYGLAEAEKLAKLWNITDLSATKAEAGRRLLAGQTLPIPPESAPTDSEDDAQRAAFFDAGYGWDDAVKLAKLWKLADPGQAKVKAGAKLLAGQTLPIKPHANSEAQADKQVNAFFGAGYDYDDAVKLAKLWKTKSPYDAKVEAGKRLLAGKKLPIAPSAEKQEEARLDAYFAAGYGWDEAVKLAKLWKLADPGQAKVKAGAKLLAGQTLPIKPPAESEEDKQVDKFFDAGYDYDDAVKLAKLWKTASPYDAKVKAGAKLLAGQTLPIQP